MKTCTIRLEKEDCFLDKGRISIDEWFIVETHGRASVRWNDYLRAIPGMPAKIIIRIGLILNFQVRMNAAPKIRKLL